MKQVTAATSKESFKMPAKLFIDQLAKVVFDQEFVLGKEVKQPQDSPRLLTEGQTTPSGSRAVDFTQEILKKC